MSAGRGKRRAAARGEKAEREAWRQNLKQSGKKPWDLSSEEISRIYDPRPIGRDQAAIDQFATICTRCGIAGHWAKSCPSVLCHTCGKPGHKAWRCPTGPT